jgi:hypothetical protein
MPERVITTKRLILRPPEQPDAGQMSRPPSISNAVPVTMNASSEAR